jgi:hypothetical protein
MVYSAAPTGQWEGLPTYGRRGAGPGSGPATVSRPVGTQVPVRPGFARTSGRPLANYRESGVGRACNWGPRRRRGEGHRLLRRSNVRSHERPTAHLGRSSGCTICLDPVDRGISRRAGSVEQDSGSWWLHNRSISRALVAVDDMGIRSVVAPGRRMTVDGHLTVMVEGSVRRHALEVRVGREEEPWRLAASELPTGELPTAAGDEVLINSLDRLALVALFSGFLEPFPRYDPHPKSYADAAALLSWPRTTLVKRVEHLRARLTSAGIPNLVGPDALVHLAEWSLTTRVLSRDDLALIGR